MAIIDVDYTGSGTAQDPFHVKTVTGFLYCSSQTGAICFVDNDLNAKHDPVNRFQIDPMDFKASVICGKYMPYDPDKNYIEGDRCTFNDPDAGNLVYRCINPCISASPMDTRYFTPESSAYVKLIGFKVQGDYFIKGTDIETCTVANIFFDSCVHIKTTYDRQGTTFQVGTYLDGESVEKPTNLYFNDCKLSFAIQFQKLSCHVDYSSTLYKNRCAEYYRFVGNDIIDNGSGSGTSYVSTAPIFGCTRYACTVEFKNVYLSAAEQYITSLTSGGVLIKNASYCSFVGSTKLKTFTYYPGAKWNRELIVGGNRSCFYSFSCTPYGSTAESSIIIWFHTGSGISIANKTILSNIGNGDTKYTGTSGNPNNGVNYDDYTSLATEEECKDRDWLLDNGFIVG